MLHGAQPVNSHEVPNDLSVVIALEHDQVLDMVLGDHDLHLEQDLFRSHPVAVR